jgi:hypothetical protein
MGFFDRFAAKKTNPPATPSPSPAAAPSSPTPASAEASLEAPQAASPAAPMSSPSANTSGPTPVGVKAQLLAAREKLEAKDLPAALAIYEELLRTAGDRADVLVALSADLGTCGFVEPIVELVAPRYDAERHGPATGLNLLQAYLATRNTTAAQHLLDILFGLQRPELEERLHGFSNALAELLEAERRGQLAPTSAVGANGTPAGAPEKKMISLVSISRPIWSYGLDALPEVLPPSKDGRLRRIAFGQIALLSAGPDFAEKMKQPEDDLARFTRGLPLWLAETFYFAPHYNPIAAAGLVGKDHYATFPTEWTTENIRQLVETSGSGLDYVFTGAMKHTSGDFELLLRVWEVKKFRERKQFTARWTPATADAELARLHEQLRLFMEWQAYPTGAGLAYTPPTSASAWIDTLGISLAFFLADKSVLPKEQIAAPAETLARVADRAARSEKDALAWLTLRDRAIRLGFTDVLPPEPPLMETPLVEEARASLGG